MYWHNGRSLGHTSEVAKISKGLSEKLPNVKLLGVTGAFKGLDMVSKDMEIVKVQIAIFRGQQGRISRPVRAILNGQF